MIRNKNFVFTTLQSWDLANPTNAQSIALEMSRRNNVLYVNPPLDMMSLIKGFRGEDLNTKINVIRGNKQAITRINKSLWVLEPPLMISSINMIKNDALFDNLNKRNNRKFSRAIYWAINHLEFDEVIHINDSDLFCSFYMKELLSPELSIYLRHDNLLSLPYWEYQGKRLEPKLIRKSDIVLTNTDALAESSREYNFNTFNVGQGVDIEDFDPTIKYQKPFDMRGIPNPIIGYAGNLGALHISPNLIYKLAKERPNYSIVLAGDQDDIFSRHSLHNLHNVYFVGSEEHNRYAAYISHFDVCIYPQAVNDITEGIYPRKIDEYLSLGKPVVAVDSEAMDIFYRQIHVTNNEKQFISLVDRAWSEKENSSLIRQRIEFASTHTWNKCVERIYAVINIILKESYVEDINSPVHSKILS